MCQVAQEREGKHSPRETRSAKKNKKNRLPPFIRSETSTVLTFSPPDQEANRRREEEELARRHASRDNRVQHARDNGQFLEFSPSGRPRQNFDEAEDSPMNKARDIDSSAEAQEPSNPKEKSVQEKAAFNIREAQHEILLANVGGQNETIQYLRETMDKLIESKSFDEGAKSEKLVSLETRYEDLEQTNAKLEESLKANQLENTELKQQMVDTKERFLVESAKNEAEASAAKRAMEQSQTEKEALTAKVDEMKMQFLVDKTKLESEIEGLTREAEIRMEGLTDSRAGLEQDKARLAARVEELENDLVSSKEELTETKSARSKLESDKEHIATAKTSLESEMETLVTEKRALGDQVAELKERIIVANKDLESREHACQSTDQTLAEFKNKIKHLEKELETSEKDKEAERRDFQQLNEQSAEAFAKLEGKRVAEVAALNEEIESIATDLEAEQLRRQAAEDGLKADEAKQSTESKELTSQLEADVAKERSLRQSVEVKLKQEEEVANAAKRELELQKEANRKRDSELEQLTLEVEAMATDLEGELNRARKLEKLLKQSELEASESLKELQSELDTSEDKLALADSEKGFLQEKVDELQNNLESLRADKNAALDQQSEVAQALSEKEKELVDVGKTVEALREDLHDKQVQVKEIELKLKTSETERSDALKRMETFDDREGELFNKLQEGDRIRRELHNKVMELSGNIRVFVRVRPELPGEKEKALKSLASNADTSRKRKHALIEETPFKFPGIYDRDGAEKGEDLCKNFLELLEPPKDRGGLKDRRKKWRFGFDHVFAPATGQEEIWEATEPLVQSAVDGYNVCLFAYGQTGSGKTYTMLGDQSNKGVVARAVSKLFEAKAEMEALSKGRSTVVLSVELLEIYNEKIRDLLSSDAGRTNQNLKVTSTDVEGNILRSATSVQDVMEILQLAQSRRCVKSTESNAESSRSHMVFTIHFHVTTEDGVSRNGKLHVCDLAGSERLNKSGANSNVGGSLLKETKAINSSLSVLSNVIEKLQQGSSNVPFRESKLTMLLQNSLGGNSKTLAFVCCNPMASHFHETLCSLRFADKVNKVELKATSNFAC